MLIVQSRTNEIIPFHHGVDLFAAAKPPKEFWPIDHARHVAAFTTEANRRRLVGYLDQRFAACDTKGR